MEDFERESGSHRSGCDEEENEFRGFWLAKGPSPSGAETFHDVASEYKNHIRDAAGISPYHSCIHPFCHPFSASTLVSWEIAASLSIGRHRAAGYEIFCGTLENDFVGETSGHLECKYRLHSGRGGAESDWRGSCQYEGQASEAGTYWSTCRLCDRDLGLGLGPCLCPCRRGLELLCCGVWSGGVADYVEGRYKDR